MVTCAPVSSASNHVYLVIGVLPPLWSGRCSREQRAGEQDAVPHDCPPSGTAVAAEGAKTLRFSGRASLNGGNTLLPKQRPVAGARAARPEAIRPSPGSSTISVPGAAPI